MNDLHLLMPRTKPHIIHAQCLWTPIAIYGTHEYFAPHVFFRFPCNPSTVVYPRMYWQLHLMHFLHLKQSNSSTPRWFHMLDQLLGPQKLDWIETRKNPFVKKIGNNRSGNSLPSVSPSTIKSLLYSLKVYNTRWMISIFPLFYLYKYSN
jgi:hypothetical protein